MYTNNPDPNNVIDVDVVEVIPNPRAHSFWDALLGSNGSSALMNATQQAILIDKCRASLTYSAIQHVTAYTALEQQMASFSPLGAQRIGALINAYTAQAQKAIQGW